MGFGTIKGFARKAFVPLASVLIRGGGGNMLKTEIALTSDAPSLLGGGGPATKTETALTETVVLSSGSYP